MEYVNRDTRWRAQMLALQPLGSQLHGLRHRSGVHVLVLVFFRWQATLSLERHS